MTFDDLIDGVLRREGGYVNHQDDRGGATNLGITQRTYTMWRVEQGLGFQDVKDISRGEARAIYRDKYWAPARCDDLPASVREIHFDAAVNHGVTRAARLLQEAAGADTDGRLGPMTLTAAHRMDPDLLVAKYVAARYRFYGSIIDRDRSQLTFITGWMRRMKEFS